MAVYFMGKVQEAYSALSAEQSLDYELAKAAVLKVHELVPEAYQHKYCYHRKPDNQSHVEFVREKEYL